MNRILSIFQNEYPLEKPWSQRHVNNHHYELIKNIRRILNIFSGNELVFLLKDLIKPDEMKLIAINYYNGLKNLSEPINNVKKKNKHFFIRPLKLAHLTLPELKIMGYKLGKGLWESCKRKHNRLNGGKPRVNNQTIKAIKDTMKKLSNNSSFKTVSNVYAKIFNEI